MGARSLRNNNRVLKRKSLLFLKKKKQKDFSRFPDMVPPAGLRNERMKVFWFSFSKENNPHNASHEESRKVHRTLSADDVSFFKSIEKDGSFPTLSNRSCDNPRNPIAGFTIEHWLKARAKTRGVRSCRRLQIVSW